MSLINKRIFVEKKDRFRTEAQDLYNELKENLQLSAEGLRLFNIYDIFDIDSEDYEKAKKTVFTEVMTDTLYETLDCQGKTVVVWETLPGQYDQRADSAMQCVKLLNPASACRITTGKLMMLEGEVDSEMLKKIEAYVINPIESRVKDLSRLAVDQNVDVKPLEQFPHFIEMDTAQIRRRSGDRQRPGSRAKRLCRREIDLTFSNQGVLKLLKKAWTKLSSASDSDIYNKEECALLF